MITIICLLNFAIVGATVFLPNEYLAWNSYLLYGIQACLLLPAVLLKTRYLKDLFLPTSFVLAYQLVSLTLGGYLVPRGFGHYKGYQDVVLASTGYNLIVPFLLLTNLALFILSCRTLRILAVPQDLCLRHSGEPKGPARLANFSLSIVVLIGFLFVTLADLYSLFSFQLALLIILFSVLSKHRVWYRYFLYLFFLGFLVQFDNENKREIIITLFLILFLEFFYGRNRLVLNLRSIFVYAFATAIFFTLILTSSIMRGYGTLGATSVTEAIESVPAYVGSADFVDGITDNLELNYSYGAAIVSMNMVLTGEIKYQKGLTLVKVLFLPISREWFPAKPKGMMQLFTEAYVPEAWEDGGSLPVFFSSEMFVNFHYFGLVVYLFIMWLLNRFFIGFHNSPPQTLLYYTNLFFLITVFPFVRGSGLEQYVLYYLCALPVLILPIFSGMILFCAKKKRAALRKVANLCASPVPTNASAVPSPE
ncbi:MAG: hypothetical protein ABI273_16530 [Lacunisphaera sp.]